MKPRGNRHRWRATVWGAALAGALLILVPLLPAFAQTFGPFKDPFRTLGLTAPNSEPKRRAAPSRTAAPTLPLRKPAPPAAPEDVASEDVAAAEEATPVPSSNETSDASEPVAAPVEAVATDTPAPEETSRLTPEADGANAAETAEVPTPHPVRNPVRTGSDPDAAQHPVVTAALAQCVKLLKGLDLEYEHLKRIKRGPCGTVAPIKLKTIGKNPKIAVSPPAIVNCTVAATLHEWFRTSVQPTAEALGTSVVKIKNAASYMCRNQYGRPDTRLSEHAKANALDIKAFVLASGQVIPILGNWPYGYRPERPRVAEAPWPNPLRDHSTLPPPRTPGISVFNKDLDYQEYTEEADEFAQMATHPFFKPVFAAPLELPDPEDEEPEGPVPEGNLSRAEAKTFLRTIHGDACKLFWTVLGPESNAAHRDHFHFDMRKRRYVKICQ